MRIKWNFFDWLNPSDRIMGLGLIQPVRGMSARGNSQGVKAASVLG